MRHLSIFFIFFYSIILNSQNSAKINYIVIPTGGSLESNEDVLKSKVSSSFIGVDDALKKLDYELLINGNKSYFHLISSLDFNEKASRIARAFAGYHEYYCNKVTNQLIKVISFSGEKFNVCSFINKDWELTDETKLINGYKCYKAFIKKKLRIKKSDNIINVVAWYCPSIPLNFGPKEFCDLPGLIMELQDDKVIYLVSKIDLVDKLKTEINDFKEKIINEDEFYKIVDITFQNTINSLQKE